MTGRTKESWQMDTKENSQGVAAYVGSNYENAIWEEFGTGEYALHGDSRKGGWFYEDAKGEGYFTKGKPPKRPLHHAFVSKKGTCERIIKDNYAAIAEVKEKIAILSVVDEGLQSKIYQRQYQERLYNILTEILDRLNPKNYSSIEEYLKDISEDSFLGVIYSLHKQKASVMIMLEEKSLQI